MLFGCAKKKPPDPRTEPWPAVPSAAASARLPDELQTYVLGPPSRVWFEVPGREAKPKGELGGLSGKLELLFAAAHKTRATIHADLSTLSMLDESGVPSDSYTEEARNWLDLGAKQAEAVRKRFSTATFELKSVGSDPTRLAALVAGGEKASRRA